MSPYEAEEARRGFSAILAAVATQRLLFMGLRKPAFGFFRQIGVPAKEAVKRSKLLRHQVAAVGAGFVCVAGERE